MSRPEPDSRLDVALSVAKHLGYVFPKTPKEAVAEHGYSYKVRWSLDASRDPEQIATWWLEHPEAQIGVYTGKSGLVVVDVDEKNGKSGSASLAAAGIGIPDSFHYVTKSGGEHHYFTAPAGVDLTTAADHLDLEGVDIRSGNGVAVYYGPALTSAPVMRPAPEWALKRGARSADDKRDSGAGQSEWFARLTPGKPDKAVKRALKAIKSEGMGHNDLLEAVADLARTGVEGHPGVAEALERGRAIYSDGYGPEYRKAWNDALKGSIARQGLPRQTFDLTKAEKKSIARRRGYGLDSSSRDGAAVLQEVRMQLERFVSAPSEHAAIAITLWIAHTHLIDLFESTPRLALLSPEPGSGKTRTLEICAALVHDPVETINTSASFLARRISATTSPPTLLVDEIDTVYGPKSNGQTGEELRGIYNSGHRRGAKFSRAAVRGKEVVTEEFETFAAVAMAGLGDLPDTVMTRAVIIRMRRRAPTETVEPYRQRTNGAELAKTRARLASWAKDASKLIGTPWPELPEGIVDRDADVWEPLIAIADAAGGKWRSLAREAALAIVTDSHARPARIGTQLLADVRRVLAGRDKIRSIDLLGQLLALEDAPWADLGGRGPIDSRFLGRTFSEYQISSAHTIRFDSVSPVQKGWYAADFADAWARYLADAQPPLTTVPLIAQTPKRKKP